MKIEFDQARAVWRRNDSDFTPQIWLGDDADRPPSCNCQVVSFDCTPRSLLRWGKELDRCAQLAAQGILLVWRLDSGLIDESMNRIDKAHLEVVLRAFEHFNTEIWPRFGKYSLCAILNVGHLSQNRSSDQIKGDCAILRTLSSALSLECLTGLLIDVSELSSSQQLQKLDKELFCHLHLFLKTHLAHLASLTWNSFSRAGSIWSIPPLEEHKNCPTPPISLALLQIQDLDDPPSWQLLGELAQDLEQRHCPYRVIPMASLHEQWHQLDEIVVVAPRLTLRQKRQLEGFCAAGGTVVRAGAPVGLAHEIEFSKWQQHRLFRSQS